MIATLLAVALQAAAPAPPPPPAPAPVQRLAPAPARGAEALKAMGMSDAGIRVLQLTGGPDPDSKAFGERRAALHARIAALADAQPFDQAAFVAALKDENAVEGEARNRSIDRITRTLQALAPADRPVFAHAVLGRRAPPAATPPPPPPQPPR